MPVRLPVVVEDSVVDATDSAGVSAGVPLKVIAPNAGKI
jgi:hypothetical protein